MNDSQPPLLLQRGTVEVLLKSTGDEMNLKCMSLLAHPGSRVFLQKPVGLLSGLEVFNLYSKAYQTVSTQNKPQNCPPPFRISQGVCLLPQSYPLSAARSSIKDHQIHKQSAIPFNSLRQKFQHADIKPFD